VLTLQAPQRLLEVLQVHVVGGLPADPAEQLIPIQGADGEEALVCAVPFLRDADLRNILPGESYEARQQRLREGIATHYQKLAQLAAPWKQRGQFVCATGHLFVANGQSSDSEKEIHIGLQDRFPVADFPDFFDYLALGHLHRPQRVGGMNHVRYSGSPLPLSFSERQDSKSVLLLEVEKGTLQQIRELPLPIPRRLLRLQGTVEEVCEKLQALEEPAGEFEDWMEARVQLEAPEPEVDRKLQEIAEAKPRLHLLQVRTEYTRQASGLEKQAPVQNLEDLQPREVFQELCLSHELADDETQRQLSTFGELLERHEEAKNQ
jgi:exonuclease SbcD